MNLLKRESRSALLCGAILLGWSAICGAAQPADSRATENVILLMTDGLRWQEVFTGAGESLLTK